MKKLLAICAKLGAYLWAWLRSCRSHNTHTHTHGTHTRSICQLSTSIMSTFVGILSTIFEHNYEKRFSHNDKKVAEGKGGVGSVRGLQRSRTGCDFGFKGCILNALNVTTFDAAHLPAPPLVLLLLPPPPPLELPLMTVGNVCVWTKEQNVWWKLQSWTKNMKKKKRKNLIERKRKRVTPI